MRSVSQKKQSAQRIYQCRNQPLQFSEMKQYKSPYVEEELRRYSQFPIECKSTAKKESLELGLRNNKREDRVTPMKNVTGVSRVQTSIKSEYETQYRKLQQVLKKQNQTLVCQNDYLKQQIGKLYKREAKHKCLIKRYKEQLQLLKMQNVVYQQRYQEIKSYVNTVIQKITQVTISNQVIQDKDMQRNSSIQLVSKLREELNLYDQLKSQRFKPNQQQNETHSQQQSVQFHSLLCDVDNQNNLTNNFVILSGQKSTNFNDLQETRYLKQHKYNQPLKSNHHSLKKPPRPTPSNVKKVSIQTNENQVFSPLSFEQSSPSNQNSDTKNTGICTMKTDKFLLQDTSQSNHRNFVNHQIQELTDQSQALMYELKKTGNKDHDIKKKIIRISQKIRELKMQTQAQQLQKFTSLQEFVPEY